MILFIRKNALPACFAALVSLSSWQVMAQDKPSTATEDPGLFPPQAAANAPEYQISSDEDTHPMMRLTPDKSVIVNLDTDVKSLIVGNPLHLNVIMDTTKRLVLVPRSPGATQFTALAEDGHVIMQRHVIVASPMEKYVRIRRACNAAAAGGQNTGACENTSVFYCPDMCHPVNIVTANTPVPITGQGSISPSASPGGLGRTDTETMGEPSSMEPAINPFDLLMRALQNSQGVVPAPEEEE
ncbi:MAG TPA: pilus assembly protein N-terminal domain-containing protein [Alphaproteobacteria bacterium]